LDDIEKSVYDAQAMKRYYSPSSLRLEKIKEYIKLAAKNGNNEFIQQALGHGLYTAIEIEKRKTRREKRCAFCVSAVKKYMDTIKEEVGSAVFQNMIGVNEKVTLMFAIDTTGSMSAEIATAKAIAKGIVDHPRQQTEVDYILSPFNDPECGPVTKAGEGEEFLKAIEDLSATGGGDCPELAFTGIIRALNEGAENDSPLFVFTDATAKDEHQLLPAKLIAKGKRASVYFFTTGLCGQASYKPFEELASDSCGQMFEIPKRSNDLAKMSNITKSLLRPASCDTGTGGDQSRRKKRSGGSEYQLPFDDVMEKVIVSVATQNTGATIDLKDPRGVPVSSGETTLAKGAIFEIDHPRPGMWNLTVSPEAGKYSYVIKAFSKTNVDFDFVFVIPRKRMSPLPISHPLTGTPAHAILIVRASHRIRSTSLSLVILSKNGAVLNTTSVSPVGTSGAHFSASFATPTVPFRLKLRGRTKKNFDFERSSHNIVHPSHTLIRVRYASHEFTVPIRGSSMVMFLVYNTGSTEMFDLKVQESSIFTASMLMSAVRVHQNRSSFLIVRFSAKSTATSGTADNVIVTATGRTSNVSVNHAFSLMVV